MPTYTIALWPKWHPYNLHASEDLPIDEDVEADDPYTALYALMASRRLKRVGHAAIACPEGIILRYDDVDAPVEEVAL